MNMMSACFSWNSAWPEPSRCATMNDRLPTVPIMSVATLLASSFCERARPFAWMSEAFHTCVGGTEPPCSRKTPTSVVSATCFSMATAYRTARRGASVLVENALHVGQRTVLEQRQPQQHARFLRALVARRDEAQLVVVELDVAADAAGNDPRGADADDALARLRGERLDGSLGQVAVADARDDDALRPGCRRGVDEGAVHVLVRHDDVDARQRRHAVEGELRVGRAPADRAAVELRLAVGDGADQARLRREERLHGGRAGLGQRAGAVDPVVDDDEDAAARGAC